MANASASTGYIDPAKGVDRDALLLASTPTRRSKRRRRAAEDEDEEEQASPKVIGGSARASGESSNFLTLTDPDLLDCPICFNNLSIPVYQCLNGHLACPSCCIKVQNKCPSCSSTIGHNRCRPIEKIIESIKTSCQNPSKGKAPTAVDAPERQQQEEVLDPRGVAFIPPTGSSTQQPMYYDGFSELIGEERLATLSQTYPGLVGGILHLWEEHVVNRPRREEEVRLAMEHETELRRLEAEERERHEGELPRRSATEEARDLARPGFDKGVPILPEPHLFVPRGFRAYQPKSRGYSADLVVRDPEHHLSMSWAKRECDTTRSHGGAADTLEMYRGLHERVRELVDAAGFGQFVQILSPWNGDLPIIIALAERWHDTSNTFHLPLGEMTLTPTDFAAITGLRVGGDPIPFDHGIHEDNDALRWYLGMVPRLEQEMVRYSQFKSIFLGVPETEQQAEQMARAFILYMFGTSLLPNRRNSIHLSYLPALRDLRTAARFNWGGAAMGTCYTFMGEVSRDNGAIAGFWRIWEMWCYEVLRMYPPQTSCPDLKIFPRGLKWGKDYRGKKDERGELMGFRLYLDKLTGDQLDWDPWKVEGEPEYVRLSRRVTASRVLRESAFGWRWYFGDRVTRQSLGLASFVTPGLLPPQASHTDEYTRAEIERYTTPMVHLESVLRRHIPYATYQKENLARILEVEAYNATKEEAQKAKEERKKGVVVSTKSKNGKKAKRLGRRAEEAEAGLPELPWTLDVHNLEGDAATIHFTEARKTFRQATGPASADWVNEAMELIYAMQKELWKAASGAPLQLHYDKSAPSVIRVSRGRQGAHRAATKGGGSQHTHRSTTATLATAQRQVGSSQPARGGLQIRQPSQGGGQSVRTIGVAQEVVSLETRRRSARAAPFQQETAQKKKRLEEPEVESEETESAGPGGSNDLVSDTDWESARRHKHRGDEHGEEEYTDDDDEE